MRGLLAALALLLGQPAQAVEVTIQVTGSFSDVPDELLSQFSPNDRIEMRMTFDSTVTDLSGNPFSIGFRNYPSLTSFLLQSGTFIATASQGQLQIVNQMPSFGAQDAMQVGSNSFFWDLAGPPIEGFQLTQALINVLDEDATVFDGNEQPLDIDLAEFELREIIMDFDAGAIEGPLRVVAPLETVVWTAPEPTSIGAIGPLLVVALRLARRVKGAQPRRAVAFSSRVSASLPN